LASGVKTIAPKARMAIATARSRSDGVHSKTSPSGVGMKPGTTRPMTFAGQAFTQGGLSHRMHCTGRQNLPGTGTALPSS